MIVLFLCKVCVALCVSYVLHLLLLSSCYTVHILRIVNIMEVYIERSNMQVESILDLTRFNKIAIQGTPQMAVD